MKVGLLINFGQNSLIFRRVNEPDKKKKYN